MIYSLILLSWEGRVEWKSKIKRGKVFLRLSLSRWGNFWGEKENYFNLKLISNACMYKLPLQRMFSYMSSECLPQKGKFMEFLFSLFWVMSCQPWNSWIFMFAKIKMISNPGERVGWGDANKANGDFFHFLSATHTHSLTLLACTAVEQFTTHREFNISPAAVESERNIFAIYMYVHTQRQRGRCGDFWLKKDITKGLFIFVTFTYSRHHNWGCLVW